MIRAFIKARHVMSTQRPKDKNGQPTPSGEKRMLVAVAKANLPELKNSPRGHVLEDGSQPK